MRRKLSLSLLSIGLFSDAASLNAQENTDYNHSANFSSYKTYSWLKVQSGDSLWDDRIKQDVDSQLAAKGWTEVDSNGDASVSALRSTHDQNTLETFYNGFGGGSRWRGVGDGNGMATTTTEVTKVGSVTVNIFDTHTQSRSGAIRTALTCLRTQTRTSRSSRRISTTCLRSFPRSSIFTSLAGGYLRVS
jgi:hypothetical protein